MAGGNGRSWWTQPADERSGRLAEAPSRDGKLCSHPLGVWSGVADWARFCSANQKSRNAREEWIHDTLLHMRLHIHVLESSNEQTEQEEQQQHVQAMRQRELDNIRDEAARQQLAKTSLEDGVCMFVDNRVLSEMS